MNEVNCLEPLARASVSCNECFCDGRIKRSFVDLAQPRYVGPGYWKSRRRVVFLMLNPGAGKEEPRNVDWKRTLQAFQTGTASLNDVFQVQRRHMPFWNGGKLIRFIAYHGLAVEEIALVNIAWCATDENKYPSWMLKECLHRHTMPWLHALEPKVVILSGTATHQFEKEIGLELCQVQILRSFHYAHRPPDTERAMARAEEIVGILNSV